MVQQTKTKQAIAPAISLKRWYSEGEQNIDLIIKNITINLSLNEFKQLKTAIREFEGNIYP